MSNRKACIPSPVTYAMRMQGRYLIQLAKRRVGNPSKLKCLDVGCSDGAAEAIFASEFHKTVAIDIDPEVIRLAQSRQLPRTQFKCVNADTANSKLQFPSHTFDIVTAFSLLHHLLPEQRRSLLQEMRRVLKPDGALIIFEYNPWNPLTRIVLALSPADRGSILLKPSKVLAELGKAGFQVEDWRYILSMPPGPIVVMQRWEEYFQHVLLGAKYVIVSRYQL